MRGRRREVSLRTRDRRIAERRLRDWVNNLHRIDGEKERTTFAELVNTYVPVTGQTDPAGLSVVELVGGAE